MASQFRLILTYQLRRFPIVACALLALLMTALPFALRAGLPSLATAELSRALVLSLADLGLCLATVLWAADMTGAAHTIREGKGDSTSLDHFLRGYDRYSMTRSSGFLLAAWLLLAPLALSAATLLHIALRPPMDFETALALLAAEAITLWLKLGLLYTAVAAFRYVISPMGRLALAAIGLAFCHGLFYLSPYLPDALLGGLSTSLLAMDFRQFVASFGSVGGPAGVSVEAALMASLPLAAVLVFVHELTGFIGELRQR